MATTSNTTLVWLCQTLTNARSRGIFYGDNPLNFSTPIFYLQLSVSVLFTTFFQFLLNPLGENAFISQMLAGIVLGPSFLGEENAVADAVYPVNSFYCSQTIALFGCMMFLFLVGVKMDITTATRSGKKGVVIGVSAFLVPLLLNIGFALVLQRTVAMEEKLHNSILIIAVLQCMSSFHVTACLLEDLKLLNTEIGRLAASSSMISGMLAWTWITVTFTIRTNSLGKSGNLTFMALCLGSLIILVVYILRPILLWMVARATKGKPIGDGYIVIIFVMIMLCSLIGEFTGHKFIVGPMILGLAVPDGPPLGSALVDKLETFVSMILLPNYFVFSAARIKFSNIRMRTAGIVELLAAASFFGKLIGIMVPSLYCKMPATDALSLGLIMSIQGITDILMMQHSMLLMLIDEELYSIMFLSIFIMNGIIAPTVKFLYNPSKRYKTTKRRRTIEHSSPNGELRMLVCIYRQECTPSIINLVEVSNPSPKSPICLYVVNLIRLSGRTAPILITHRAGKNSAFHSERIINAFGLYQNHSAGTVIMTAFTAIAPFATMHDDVCTLALEKQTAIVIVPFHKQYGGPDDQFESPVRSVNRNILRNAPCSVGILVDRGTLNATALFSSQTSCNVCAIFIDGPDDREALSYATRMADHPNVRLTVIRLLHKRNMHREMDADVINSCRVAIAGKKQHVFREEVVKDSVEMINVIRSIDNFFDLFLVGRRHDSGSELFMGLTEWNEFPELGFVGDMLVSSDTNFEVSVLVVQQHTFGVAKEIMPETFRGATNGYRDPGIDSYSAVDVPSNKISISVR